MNKKLDPKDVEIFLLENLNFFESRESLVSELKFKHGESSAASLLERQVLKLRDEHSKLIDMLSGFVDTASENEDLFLKSKKLTLDLINCSNKKEVSKFIIIGQSYKDQDKIFSSCFGKINSFS